MTEAGNILTVRHLRAWIGQSQILHGLDFDVPRGQVTALMGRNGVGKTTTLRSVVGQVRCSGSVRFEGAEVVGRKTSDIVRSGIAYVPEDREVFGSLTVGENLKLADRTRAGAREELVFDLFPELRRRYKQRAGTLSGGQQQMLALGRAMMNDDPLLLVDEPTKGLAPLVVAEVADSLARAAELASVLLVEQNLSAIRRMASSCIVIDRGRIAHAGAIHDLLDDADLTYSLLGVGSLA